MAGRKSRNKAKESDRFLDSLLFKISARALLGLIIVTVFLTLAQCTIKSPESPSWDANLVIPVLNRTYQMDELIRKMDQDGVQMDSSGGVTFSIIQEIDTVRLDSSNLSTADIVYSTSERLGVISVDPPALSPITSAMSDVSGLSTTLPGDSAFVPPIGFDLPSDMPAITSFASVTVSTGQAVVNVTNELGIDLDTAIVQIFDIAAGSVVAVDSFTSAISSGSSDSLTISLDGKTVSNQLRIDVHGHTPGGIVGQASTRYITVSLDFGSTLEVTAATAQVPALSRSFSQQVDLAESDRIDSASLVSGQLQIDFTNATVLSADMVVTIPDLLVAGTPLTVVDTLPAGQSGQVVVNLAGAMLIPSSQTVPQAIQIDVIAGSPGSGVGMVTVNATDSFRVDASLTNLGFGFVSGVFDSVSASIPNVHQSITVPTGFDSIQLASATLTVEIDNGVDIPGNVALQVQGDNGKTLNLVGNIEPSGLALSRTSIIRDTSIAAFLSPIPSAIDVSGSVTFGDGSYQGTISGNDVITGRIRVEAPLEMTIGESVVAIDIEEQNISQGSINKITDHVVRAVFIYNVINHLPIGATINILMGADTNTIYSSPQLRIDSITVNAAPTSAGGLVIDPLATGYQEILLDSADIRIIENDPLFIAPELILHSSNGQVIKLTQDDYITVIGRVEVQYRVGSSL